MMLLYTSCFVHGRCPKWSFNPMKMLSNAHRFFIIANAVVTSCRLDSIHSHLLPASLAQRKEYHASIISRAKLAYIFDLVHKRPAPLCACLSRCLLCCVPRRRLSFRPGLTSSSGMPLLPGANQAASTASVCDAGAAAFTVVTT